MEESFGAVVCTEVQANKEQLVAEAEDEQCSLVVVVGPEDPGHVLSDILMADRSSHQ